jgi:hypothetical protein
MTTARALYCQCRAAGIALAASGGGLVVSAPAGVVLPLAELAAAKAEMLAVLAGDYLAAGFALAQRIADPARRIELAEQFDLRALSHRANGADWPNALRGAYCSMARSLEAAPPDPVNEKTPPHLPQDRRSEGEPTQNPLDRPERNSGAGKAPSGEMPEQWLFGAPEGRFKA